MTRGAVSSIPARKEFSSSTAGERIDLNLDSTFYNVSAVLSFARSLSAKTRYEEGGAWAEVCLVMRLLMLEQRGYRGSYVGTQGHSHLTTPTPMYAGIN